jgi:hypothetical protein
MPSFMRKTDGAVLVLDRVESELLSHLVAELRELVAGTSFADDPVRERLFPTAYESPEDQASYHEMTADDLESEKIRALDMVSATLAGHPIEIELNREDLGTWLACLTDLRLAIGTRLGVDEERMAAEVDHNDPDAQALTVLHWLGWVQEGLLRAAAGAELG